MVVRIAIYHLFFYRDSANGLLDRLDLEVDKEEIESVILGVPSISFIHNQLNSLH